MNFTANDLPHIAHEHIQSTWLFTLSLNQVDDENYEVKANLLGKERKVLTEELVLMVEQYIQKN